jgi:SET domain
MNNPVESAYIPTWSSLGLDGSHYNRSKSNHDNDNNSNNLQKHETFQTTVKSDEVNHNNNNNNHKVVRRSRREELETRTSADIHDDPQHQDIILSHDSQHDKQVPSAHLENKSEILRPHDSETDRQQKYHTLNSNDRRKRPDIEDVQMDIFSFLDGYSDGIDEKLQHHHHQIFMTWCKDVLGIYTILEIQTFEYIDYMHAYPVLDLEDDMIDPLDQELQNGNGKEQPRIKVRGLAAGTDIDEGDVVIRIPLKALWSLITTIDNDPVLGGNVMGPSARERHGWDMAAVEDEGSKEIDEAGKMDRQFYEMPLLAVALLYHVQLGQASIYAPYIDILKSTPVHSMPFLWSTYQLKTSTASSEGVRTVARGIRQEMRDMYESVVQVLINQHPSIFGKETAQRNNLKWMYSYENFKWAFAIVNSRHWQLPIEDLEIVHHHAMSHTNESSSTATIGSASVDEQVPPAATPTEHWVQEHGDIDDEVTNDQPELQKDSDSLDPLDFLSAVSHSFLAPVADLMNFGPPCTRSRYNKDSHTFEIIATCNFRKGEEVTFWYSDECQHVMIGIYGFSHPLIPSCPTSEDLRLENTVLEDRIMEAYHELDRVEKELYSVEDILMRCECCRYEKKSARETPATFRQRADNPSGRGFKSRKSMKREGKPGVRRIYSRRSEF